MENILEKEPIIITKATPEDFEEFVKVFPQSEQGVNEFELGTKGDGFAEYLLARDSREGIIGKLYLKFEGVAEPAVRQKISHCPDLENIQVVERLQGQGIGTRLISKAEEICREKGFKKVGLGVATDNPDARKLYEKLGYRDIGLGEFSISFMWRSSPEESEHEIRESIIYLVKDL